MIAVARANLPMTTIGLAMGGNARTGMEDTLMLEPGKPAASNAQLVERLVGVARSLSREPATVDEVVERLKLSPELVRTGLSTLRRTAPVERRSGVAPAACRAAVLDRAETIGIMPVSWLMIVRMVDTSPAQARGVT